MTTERQIAANRQNAHQSTGPRTQAGKAASSRNNTRHGLYAATPVIPRLESTAAWEQHRTTTVDGLAPASAVETALAERIALILWRLGRVARYEQTVTTQAQHQAPDDLAADYQDTETDVEHIRTQYADARRNLRAFTRFRQLRPDAPMTGQEAAIIVGTISRQIEGFDLAPFSVPGLIGADDRIATMPGWTVARVHQFVDAIAAATDRNSDDLVQTAFTRAEQRHKRDRTTYRQLGRELHELRQERILPQSTGLENVIRYETHLAKQLNQTLAQLRQLQQHRAASRRRAPANDDHVDLDATPYPCPSHNPDPPTPYSDLLPPSQGEGLGEGVSPGDSNPIPPSPGLASTPEYTPWQPQSRA